MTLLRQLLASSLALLAGGCQTLAQEDVPARIVSADAASKAALQNTVNSALGTQVMLAEDALTISSILLVERTPPRSLNRQNPQGRIMEPPIRFQLFTNGHRCFLVDQRNSDRHQLQHTKCVPLAAEQ